jgi:hypothetical protein
VRGPRAAARLVGGAGQRRAGGPRPNRSPASARAAARRRATLNDSNYEHYAELARRADPPGGAPGRRGPRAPGPRPEDDAAAWAVLVDEGWGVFGGGLGHADYFPALRALQGEPPAPP